MLAACADPDQRACACVPDEEMPEWAPPPAPTCGEQLCPPVVALGYDYGEEGDFTLVSPPALDCALMALRDRTPGMITWSWQDSPGGAFHDEGYVIVLDEDTGIRRDWGAHDLSFEISDAQLGRLSDPAWFDACLGLEDELARFDCLRKVRVEVRQVCDEGWSDDSY